MNILNIIKGLAPAAINMGTQIIQTKLEENALGMYEKKILNDVVEFVADELINDISATSNNTNSQFKNYKLHHNHEYQFDIHDYM